MAYDPLFGGTQFEKQSLLTPGQEGLLGNVIGNYSNIGDMISNLQSTYQGAPQDFFRNSYEVPQLRQYQRSLADLEATNKRHSSYTAGLKRATSNDYLTGLGAQRSQFLNQERLREMQALENLRNSQMGLLGVQNQVGALGLGTRAFENVGIQDSGILGKISSLLNVGGSLAGAMAGGGI